MMRYLATLFLVQAIFYSIGYLITFFIILWIVAPFVVWLTVTHQWEWPVFNAWMGYTLVGIPVGILTAGMLTTAEWSQRSNASLITKVVVYVLMSGVLIGGGLVVVKKLKQAFPLPEKIITAPAPSNFEYIPIDVIPKPASGVIAPPANLFR